MLIIYALYTFLEFLVKNDEDNDIINEYEYVNEDYVEINMDDFYEFINENQKREYECSDLLGQNWYNMNKILYIISIMLES